MIHHGDGFMITLTPQELEILADIRALSASKRMLVANVIKKQVSRQPKAIPTLRLIPGGLNHSASGNLIGSRR